MLIWHLHLEISLEPERFIYEVIKNSKSAMRNRAPTLIVYTSAKIITILFKEKHPSIQYGSQEKTYFIQLG